MFKTTTTTYFIGGVARNTFMMRNDAMSSLPLLSCGTNCSKFCGKKMCRSNIKILSNIGFSKANSSLPKVISALLKIRILNNLMTSYINSENIGKLAP